MKNISVMIKPASSLCNMRCAYCFYTDISSKRDISSYGMMSRDTAEKVIKNVLCCTEKGDSVTFVFQGGEPTLAGLEFFIFFVDKVKENVRDGVKINFSLQTNGFDLDESWCAFLSENNFLVGLSLDMDADIHNSLRADAAGKGTFSRVMKTKALFERNRVEYNILSVLTSSLARHPKAVWNFILANNIKYVQFIPCLSPLNEKSAYALTPARYASFYGCLFDSWLEEYGKGNYISIKLFDDTINLLAYSRVGACGLTGNCSAQIVVEADGSVYPCDFYALDEFCTGNLANETLFEVYNSKKAREFLNRKKSLPSLCEGCRYFAVCGGGCERMRDQIFCREGAQLCGQKMLLNFCIAPMTDMANLLRRS